MRNGQRVPGTEPETLQRQYRALLQAAPDPIFVADVATGEIIEANEAAVELRNQPREEIVGIHQSALHPPGKADLYRELFEEHIEDGGTKRYLPDGSQIYAVTGDGERVPVEISVDTVELPDGDVIYGVFRDISDRVTKNRELEAQRERYRSLFENNPLVIWEEDFSAAKAAVEDLAASVEDLEAHLRDNPEAVQGILETIEVIDINRNALEYYGASSKAEILENLEHLFTREALEQLVGELVAVHEGEDRFRTETVSRTLDGERKDEILEFYAPGAPADYSRVYVTTMDISEERARQRELRTFEKAVEAAGHSIYVTDRDGEIEYVNPAFEETTGYSADQALGRRPNILKSGEHDQRFYEDLWRTILSGETWREEVVNRTKGGDRYVADQTIAPVMDEDDRIVRFVSVNSDITERKHREEMLEAERDRARALKQRLSVVNRIMRHDLRSAVNIIKGNADLAGSAAGEIDTMLDTIRRQADKLHRISENARLIEETLEGQESRQVTQELTSIVTAKLVTLRNSEANVAVESALPTESHVHAHQLLEEAIENVLQNAVEHNDAAQPRVRVEVAPERGPEGMVELAVADNGPGIPEDEVEPLYEGEEFALQHTSGLGLWIVYWIVNRSGGSIGFEENEPRGTVVRMWLPSDQPP